VFTTTGNTGISPGVLVDATNLGVAVWQQMVYEVPADPNDPNPDLCIGDNLPMNPKIYGTAIPVVYREAPVCSKLLAPPVQLTPIPGDPDPPEVN
jgi:hypothetical protein